MFLTTNILLNIKQTLFLEASQSPDSQINVQTPFELDRSNLQSLGFCDLANSKVPVVSMEY